MKRITMSIKGRRFESINEVLPSVNGVDRVELDEDWLPPHKMAGFTPYDVIISLSDTDNLRWNIIEFKQVLSKYDIDYDEIISFESEETEATKFSFLSLQFPSFDSQQKLHERF